MGATSVTGVSGVGSASKYGAGNKGSEHMALGVHRLIGPRVVGCGDVDLGASGGAIVVFPALPGGPNLYCPFLSFECNSPTAVPPCWFNFTATSFNVSGGDNDHVCWQIVKKGLWGSLENDGPSSVIANT